MIPLLFIEGREPDTADFIPVRIMRFLGPHAKEPFLLDVPLKKARLIVAAFDALRAIGHRLEDVEEKA